MDRVSDAFSVATPQVAGQHFKANLRGKSRLLVQHSGYRPIHFPPKNVQLRKVHTISVRIQQPKAAPIEGKLGGEPEYVVEECTGSTPGFPATQGENQFAASAYSGSAPSQVPTSASYGGRGFELERFQDNAKAERFLCFFCKLVCSVDFLVCARCEAKYCRECLYDRLSSPNTDLCPNCLSSCPLTASFTQCPFYSVHLLSEAYSSLLLFCRFTPQGCTALFPILTVASHEGVCRFRESGGKLGKQPMKSRLDGEDMWKAVR